MFVSTKDALSSYYYLIAVDEHVTDEERDMFDAIGNDIDPQMFGNYREELVDGCRNTVNQASLSTDRFEMLVEAVDDALHAVDTDAQDAVSSRLLVWNMLSISFADGGASEDELKMIRHVARHCGVDRDVFQEMAQLMRSASAVLNEKRYLESSNGTYAEIKPIVDEMNKRCAAIQRAAEQLIGDELAPKPGKAKMPEKDIVDHAKEKIEEGIAPAANWVQEQASNVADAAGSAAKPVLEQAGSALNSAGHAIEGALNPIGDEVQKQAKNALGAAKNVFGGLVTGPALLVMGMIVGAKAGKNLENAKAYAAQTDQYCEEMEAGAEQCIAIRRRTYMLYALLTRLDAYFLPLIRRMEDIIATEGEDYSVYSDESKGVIGTVVSTAISIKTVVDTPMLAEDGSLTEESKDLLERMKE